jgi:putative membrane protein
MFMNFGTHSFFGFGGIFMILWWAIVIFGILIFIKWIGGQNKTDQKNDKTALDILKERYAKGDINKEEFEERKKDITG